jgi:hypothetical protein
MWMHRTHPRYLSAIIYAQAEIQHPGTTCHNRSATWIPRFRGG